MEKKFLSLLVTALLVTSLMPLALAEDTGFGVDVDIETEDFTPLVFNCGNRIVLDDNSEPGRRSGGGDDLVERINNYAFEGEQIGWSVLVVDKNGIEKVDDVYVTFDEEIESNCQVTYGPEEIPDECNARIGEEEIEEFNPDTMDYFDCLLTVEQNMIGEAFITVEAVDADDMVGTMDEAEFWFFNPEIGLSIAGDITFEDVIPGTFNYGTGSLLVGNAAEDPEAGVLLDMFVSGSDFYDSENEGAMCPDSNILKLWDPDNFVDGHHTGIFYYATSGAYSTSGPDALGLRAPLGAIREVDDEGYVNIGYADTFTRPGFYDGYEVLNDKQLELGDAECDLTECYSHGNVLSPGSEITLTFLLVLPEPCNGDFDEGMIYFWGEAV